MRRKLKIQLNTELLQSATFLRSIGVINIAESFQRKNLYMAYLSSIYIRYEGKSNFLKQVAVGIDIEIRHII